MSLGLFLLSSEFNVDMYVYFQAYFNSGEMVFFVLIYRFFQKGS